MKELMQQLQKQVENYERIITNAEKFLSTAPEGSLRIIHNKNSEQYYHRQEGTDSKGSYLKKRKVELIKALAQKSYEQKALQMAQNNKKCIERLLSKYTVEGIATIYDNLSAGRKKLITPYIFPEEEYRKQWQEQVYTGKEVVIQEEANGIYTEKGELVRSKSEKILADKLYIKNIPYHYEKPLYLKGFGIIYPDFTVLNIKKRKEYYWEHLGLMDHPQYVEKAIKKIECYQQNNIFPGENLILTFETKEHPLNMRCMESMINRYLI